MKQSVDLTANQMFSQGIRTISQVLIFKEVTYRFWDYEHMQTIHSDLDLTTYGNSLIFCGNFTERQAQRFNFSLDTGEVCECCGAYLTNKPWAKHYCLCSKCSTRLDCSFVKTWRFKNDSIGESGDRVVIEMNKRGF